MALIKAQSLINFRDNLITLNNHRKIWMYLSTGVVIAVASLLLLWDKISSVHSNILWIFVASAAVVISITWWYWTMGLVHRLLDIQIDVVDILKELTTDIKDIKVEVKEFINKN